MRCSSSFSSSSSSFSSPKNLLVLQEEDWDCGLACALMVLRALQYSMSSIQGGSGRRALPSMKELRERCETQSIWTIDLAHLLRYIIFEPCIRMRVNHRQYSTYTSWGLQTLRCWRSDAHSVSGGGSKSSTLSIL
mmetsp:Transcript_34511/g.48165  ORF Transcript_34511/g.48165 Transcript_34511/m.48165 type:complete len:135 (-) Transcript_34511:609-1013(-)